MRLIASCGIFLIVLYGFIFLNRGKEGLNSGIYVIPGHSSSVGVPQNWKILKI